MCKSGGPGGQSHRSRLISLSAANLYIFIEFLKESALGHSLEMAPHVSISQLGFGETSSFSGNKGHSIPFDSAESHLHGLDSANPESVLTKIIL